MGPTQITCLIKSDPFEEISWPLSLTHALSPLLHFFFLHSSLLTKPPPAPPQTTTHCYHKPPPRATMRWLSLMGPSVFRLSVHSDFEILTTRKESTSEAQIPSQKFKYRRKRLLARVYDPRRPSYLLLLLKDILRPYLRK